MHGEETIVGTEFGVTATITLGAKERITSIKETVNYSDAFNIIKRHMENPVLLLETLAKDMADEIYLLDKAITSISITINKLNPPIQGFNGTVGVSYSKEY